MKVTVTAVSILSTIVLPTTLAQEECLNGGFRFEFEGACTVENVINEYSYQVYNAAGATPSDCTTSAEKDLEAKLAASGNTIQSLCDMVYAEQDKVPFTSAANRGIDMAFEEQFFNGLTDWQDEVETLYPGGRPTNILKEDAEQVRVFHEGSNQGKRVAWPGELSNFKSNEREVGDLATCETNAAMCCWPKDRQANDGNGNCDDPYDQRCVDKDVADNTDLCYVDLQRGNQTTDFDTSGILVYSGDGDNGEGAIHCHGLAWSNDENDHTSRYRANNLIFVSMFDHMYTRGYVKNIPGAPMCGCVEQMPTVSRSDCTQVDLAETVSIEYNGSEFTGKLTQVHIDFNACRGINNKNNDLWAYMASMYYQGKITPDQFGQAGRIITNEGCDHATRYEINKQGLMPGYDHDIDVWTNVAGRESMKLNDGYGHRAFAKSLLEGGNDSANNTHYGIIYRTCSHCISTHKKIYYRRRTPIPDNFDLITNILYHNNDGVGNNVWQVDFDLYSTYEDALEDVNAWECPESNGVQVFNYNAQFYGECSPDGTKVRNQRSRFHVFSDKHDVGYFVNKPEDQGLDILETIPIKGRDRAGGIALEDTTENKIYMTGRGRDIWSNNDDFNYFPQEVNGDHTAIVHVGNLSSMWQGYTPHPWSKQGLMFRSSLDTNAAHFSIFLTGTNGVCSHVRFESGGWTRGGTCFKKGATEAWLKIEKRMDIFTSYVGSQEVEDGPITWSVVRSEEMNNIGETYQVGLAVSSARWQAQEVVFTDYDVDSYYFPSAAPSTSSAPTMFVPSTDIGSVAIAGTASESTYGSWVVKASGADIWGRNDQFHFMNLKKTGNVTLELLVHSFDPVHNWQKGGLMVRESLATNSRHYSQFVTGAYGISTMWRSTTNGGMGHNTKWNEKSKPVYLQVTKEGSSFTTAYKYEDDAEWIAHDGPRTINFDESESDEFYVGIAVTSHNNGALATLEAEDLVIIDNDAEADVVVQADASVIEGEVGRRLRKGV